ncbi:MAG: UbiA family prenyltransferase, partial [Armatimonadota bacterium]
MARLASLVKFEHTIFALPFAFMGAVVAAHGVPSLRVTLLIVLAMVGARTAAMTFNRIVDVEIDRKNPRTARRELVTG